MIIEIDIKKELDYESDYMGFCHCGCRKELFKGMTVFQFGNIVIYNECLEDFLKIVKVNF